MSQINILLKRTTKGTLVLSLFTFLAMPLGYLIRIFYARTLTVQEFGLFYSIVGLLGLISCFNDLGLSNALSYFIPKYMVKKNYQKVKSAILMTFIVQLSTIFFIAWSFWLLAPILAESYFKTLLAIPLLRCFTLYFFFYNFAISMQNAFRGLQEEKYYGSFEFLRTLVVLTLSFSGLFVPVKRVLLYGVVWGMAYLLLGVFYFITMLKSHKEIFNAKTVLDFTLLKAHLRYSVPLLIGSITSNILLRMDLILLTYLRSVGIVGLYTVAVSLANALTNLLSPLNSLLVPFVSELDAKRTNLSTFLSTLYKYAMIFFVPLGILMFFFAKEVLIVLFSSRFMGATNALKILSIMCLFNALTALNNSCLQGLGKTKFLMWTAVLGGSLNLCLDLILIPKFGADGAAIATSGVWILCFSITLLYLRRLVNLNVKKSEILKLGFVGLLFISLIHSLKSILALSLYVEAIVVFIISLTAYSFLLSVFKIISLKNLISFFISIFGQTSSEHH